tara:strand:+ start:2505 stop:6278 length:3774 start_codon:yes stop_codon:yes gene_type:complete
MAKQTRNTLKGYFETGKTPTEGQYSNLIDSHLLLSGENTGSLQLKGDIELEGNITSSGNISGSSTSTLTIGGTLTAGAGTFTTLNTGQGANELYAMDQDVKTSNNVQFGVLTTTQHITTDITASNSISSSNKIYANQFIGDGALITGITSSLINISGTTVSFTTGSLIVSGNLMYASASTNIILGIETTGSIIPGGDGLYDVGSPTNYFKSSFVSSSHANTFIGIFKGAISSSSQIATEISGAFTSTSSSISSRLTTAESELSNTLISSSVQIATEISGAFTLTSSSLSSRLTTAESELSNTLISSSAQIASEISGAFTSTSSSISSRLTTNESNLDYNVITSSSISSRLTTAENELSGTLISSSAQISTEISGAFVLPSASFSTRTTALEAGTTTKTLVSSSAQIATEISGALSTTAIAALGGGYYSSSLQNLGNITGSNISASGTITSQHITTLGNISASHLHLTNATNPTIVLQDSTFPETFKITQANQMATIDISGGNAGIANGFTLATNYKSNYLQVDGATGITTIRGHLNMVQGGSTSQSPANITASGAISASGLLYSSASEGLQSIATYNTQSGQYFYTSSQGLSEQLDTFKQTGQRNGDSAITGSLTIHPVNSPHDSLIKIVGGGNYSSDATLELRQQYTGGAGVFLKYDGQEDEFQVRGRSGSRLDLSITNPTNLNLPGTVIIPGAISSSGGVWHGGLTWGVADELVTVDSTTGELYSRGIGASLRTADIGLLSSSFQIASDISGSWQGQYFNTLTAVGISGSFTLISASIATNIATNVTNIATNTNAVSTLNSAGLLSSSFQIESDISGALSTTAIASLGGNYYSSSLQNLGNITGSNISASGDIISQHISALGDITASNNISSSGNIFADRIYSDNEFYSAGHRVLTTDGVTTIVAQSSLKTQIDGTNIMLDGPVTASGNISAIGSISASGIISGSNLSGNNTGDQDLSSLALNTNISGAFFAPSASFSTRVTLNDAKVTNSDQSLVHLAVTSSNVLFGDITASGHISSSGTITSGDVIASGTGSFGEINLDDNKKLKLGTSDDLEIYHDGSNSYIVDTGIGHLALQGNDLRLNNADWSANYLTAANGGAVSIFYNNNNKLETTNLGVNINGNITSSGNITASNLILSSNITASGNISASGIISGSNLSGNNTGDQDLGTYMLSANTASFAVTSSNVLFGNIISSGDISSSNAWFGGSITASLHTSASLSEVIFENLPTTKPTFTGSLWLSGSAGSDSQYLVVFTG